MFRSILKIASNSAKCVAMKPPQPKYAEKSAVTLMKRYSSSAVVQTDEEKIAAWISFFENEDTDYYDFKVGFMNIMKEDHMPEPEVLQAALYACRRLDNLPLAMRVLELIKTKCWDRGDIYSYLMQELRPTMDDLGLKSVEEYKLDQFED